MNDESFIDSELRAALPSLPRFELDDIPAARELVRSIAAEIAANSPYDPSVSIEVIEFSRNDAPAVPVRMFRPVGESGALPCLLWFFAGGQVLGAADRDDAYLKALSARLNCVVAAVDYRLAPEAPAPAAAEDGYLAYVQLRDLATDLRLDRNRMGIAGASGGGGVAAATTLMIRDRGEVSPRLLSLSYPMLDDRNETTSSQTVTDVGIFDRKSNLLAWAAVLGDRAGGADVDPHCAPGRARDLSGFPPTFLAVAEIDVFRDEDLAFAMQLVADAVPTELHLYSGAFHAWDRYVPDSGLAVSFNQTWTDFLSRQLQHLP